jgi:putative transcriptional regulator
VETITGQLLIAAPGLQDPNFWRTVVLVLNHDEDGALGLVLNRPSETVVGESVPQLDGLLDLDEQVHLGGPVQPNAVIVLAEFDDPDDAALIAFERVGVLGTDPAEQTPAVVVARAFAGHAGWGPGQLDHELERGDWILEPALHVDAFSTDPSELWPTVLSRKGGSYALIARMPDDPSLN